MRDIEGLAIDEMVIHILDPDRSEGNGGVSTSGQLYLGFYPSEVSLPLEQNSPTDHYFKSHILRSLSDPRAVAARFKQITLDEPSGLVAGLFDKSISFIDASRSIAKKLYVIVEGDRRTKACDLAIVRYHAENYHGADFLAILKIDPSQVFQHVIDRTADGKEYIRFELESSAFTGEKLQKAAFIKSISTSHDSYDMILLDTQVRDTSRQDVADYFKLKFLDTTDWLDAHARTEILNKALLQAKSKLRGHLSEKERQVLDIQRDAILTSASINIDTFIDGLPFEEGIKETIRNSITEELPDRMFQIDPEYGQTLVKRRYFEGDYNLALRVDAQGFPHVIKEINENAEDDNGNPVFHIVIETKKWRETTR
jgi:hypothetical protein